jgi:6-phosphogluconolactonase
VDVEVVVTSTEAELAAATANLLVDAARAGGGIVLAGGTTPRAAYALAAGTEPDWRRARVWLGDERIVPADDPRSNARLLRETLLDALENAPEVHLVRTELAPDQAAAVYDRELRGATFGLALLGLGRDGHTASLFPNAPSLEERDRLAVAVEPGLEPWVDRVTMTPPALGAADHVVFIATGPEKAEAARRAFAEPPSADVPASFVRSAHGTTTVILDRAAAAELA